MVRKQFLVALTLVALALGTMAAGAMQVRGADHRGGLWSENFVMHESKTWRTTFDSNSSVVHIQFGESTHMRLDILDAGGNVVAHDYVAGAFYSCRFSTAGTFTIRLTNLLPSRFYNGRITIR